MAGDWVRMRVNLRKNPKVVAISRHLTCNRLFIDAWSAPKQRHLVTKCDANVTNVTELVTFENVTRVTVCALLELWGTLNGVLSGDGEAPYMVLSDIDGIVELPGFGEAMASVGWVVENEENGLIFPNFLEHNTPDKDRPKAKSGAERTREYRTKKGVASVASVTKCDENVTKCDANVTKCDGEKRREEKIEEGICDSSESNFEIDPHQPPPSPPAFIDPIAEFPETVKTHSRNIYGSYYFRRYGSLPNLSATQTGKDLRELAGRIEAYPFAVERLEEFFEHPPPNIPRTAKLWQIFNHLGLDDDGNDSRTTGGRPRNQTAYRPAKTIGNSPMSAGGGQYEGIKPRIASDD